MSQPAPERASPYTRENVRRGIVPYLLGRGMSAVAGFASIILLVRHMDVTSYAAYATLTGLTFMTATLSGLGLERAIARYVPEGRLHHPAGELARLVWWTSLVRFAAAGLLAVAYFAFWQVIDARLFSQVPLGPFTWALACYVLANTLFRHLSAVMQALVLQRSLTRILVVQWGGRLALIVALIAVYPGIDLDQAIWIMAAPEMIGALILMGAVHLHLSALGRDAHAAAETPGATWPVWREVADMALHNYGYNLLTAPPQGYFMRMLAAAVLPVPFVAGYGFFLSLFERVQPYLPLQLMYGMTEPVLIAGYVRDKHFDKLCQRSQFLFKANLLLLVPFLVWLAATTPDFTLVLTGGKFAEYSWLLFVIALQFVMGSHAVTSQLIVNAVGKSAILLKSGSHGLVAMISTLGLMVATGHSQYIAVSPVVYSIVNNLTIVTTLRHGGYDYTLPWTLIGKLSASAFVAWFAGIQAVAILHESRIHLIVVGAVIFLVFILVLSWLGGLTKKDRNLVLGMRHDQADNVKVD
jgi:O-antigen/teichoic acid export membrane protein